MCQHREKKMTAQVYEIVGLALSPTPAIKKKVKHGNCFNFKFELL